MHSLTIESFELNLVKKRWANQINIFIKSAVITRINITYIHRSIKINKHNLITKQKWKKRQQLKYSEKSRQSLQSKTHIIACNAPELSKSTWLQQRRFFTSDIITHVVSLLPLQRTIHNIIKRKCNVQK